MSRLSEIFSNNPKCFVPFVTAGHPDLDATERIVLELVEAGSHIVEIGIPFSDPIADGPVIQTSSFRALRHGYGIADYIELIRRLRSRVDAGLVFMTYMNPVWSYGPGRLAREAAEAGLDGIIISDLTPEEHIRFREQGDPGNCVEGLDIIFLAAPTSSDARLEKVSRASGGFVYLVARTGVTGKRSDVESQVPATIRRLRRYSDLPIAVGFGITSAQDVRRVWRYADAAVIGTALVRFVDEHRHDADLPRQVGRFARDHLIPG